jgi:hypothetical protein
MYTSGVVLRCQIPKLSNLMKSLFFSLLFASAAMTVSAADNPSLSGDWTIHSNIAGNESDMTCSFKQKDKALTGTCKLDGGPVDITGNVSDKRVMWTYKSEYNGSPITLTYYGNLESAEKISGRVNVEEYSVDGDFTAAPSK